ncbi:hypothetical protein ACHAWF_010318 [Thalassiosira exigua]
MLSSSARRLIASSAARRGRRVPAPSSAGRCLASISRPPRLDGDSGLSPAPSLWHRPLSAADGASILPSSRRWLSSSDELPDHVVMGMPALSPTMSAGSISKWNVAEGSSFAAGDSLAVIETDKATIDFEAQDDGIVAKLLVNEGGGEIDVGVPIMVTVEEEGDVAAFEGFSPDSGAPAAAEAPAPAAAETPAAPAAPAAAATPAEDLPYHVVVGMPALSPTMDAGTISKWNVSAGDAFAAGDSLAVIETDKATIDFEAQDDGVMAKLLVGEGSGEVAVGVPIMVTVEEEGDVAAFENFVAGSAPDSAATEASAPAPAEEAKVEPAAAAATAPAPTPTPVAASPTPVAPVTEAPVVEAAPPAVPAGAASAWGRLAAERSPLAKALASQQREYAEKYGSTGHIPLV